MPNALMAEYYGQRASAGLVITDCTMIAENTSAIAQRFSQAAKNPVAADFDDVEVHGANQRSDVYGGSMEQRSRYLFEVFTAVSEAIGSDRVVQRLSPLNSYNDMKHSDPLAWTAFLANPDLPARVKAGAPLNVPDASTFYTPGAKGYTGYPTL